MSGIYSAAGGIDLNNVEPQRPWDDIDDDEMMHQLRERAPEWVPLLFPRGRPTLDGREWRVANIHGAPPKEHGSCKINLVGDNAGDWYEFENRKGGGPISTIKEATGLSGLALMERAREYAGMPLRRAPARAVATRIDRTLDVQFILKCSAPATGTLVATYLNARGLDLPPSSDILFHSMLTDWSNRAAPIGRPAMVAVVRRPDTGEMTGGVHRTYLAEDGMRKADIEKPKMMLGPCDGAVMLTPIGADGSLGVGEGIESSLAAHKLFNVATWATLSTSGMRNFVFPPGLKRLAIFADRGEGGEAAARHLRQRALDHRIEATINLPRSDDDFAKDLEQGLWRPGEAPTQKVIAPPRSIDDIADSVRSLTNPPDETQLRSILRGMVLAHTNPIDREKLFKAIKTKAGIGVVELRLQFNAARRETGIAARMIGPAPAWADKLMLWENGEPKPTLANALIPLREDESIAGLIGYDEFNEQPALVRRPPYDCGDRPMDEFPQSWCEDDTLRLTEWMQVRGVNVTPEIVKKAVMMVAREASFHPVRRWLERLVWDGEQRLEQWLQVHVGAADTLYTRAVGSRFLISAVARVYKPGCKVDNAMILEGKQGIGKSSLLRVLFDPWFTDEIADLGTKDAAMQLRGVWAVELAELDALDRGEVRRIKAWITRTNDRYRPPYGEAVVDVPRQCLFCGSTNEDKYLRDPSGGRRFWPVRCGAASLNPHALYAVREQLWAEALVRYQTGDKWHLSEPELAAAAAGEQATRQQLDDITAFLQDAFDAGDAPFHHDLVVVNDLIEYFSKERNLKVTHKVLAPFLRRNDAVALGQKRLSDVVGGRRPPVWALRDGDQWNCVPEGVVARWYRQPCDGGLLESQRNAMQAELNQAKPPT